MSFLQNKVQPSTQLIAENNKKPATPSKNGTYATSIAYITSVLAYVGIKYKKYFKVSYISNEHKLMFKREERIVNNIPTNAVKIITIGEDLTPKPKNVVNEEINIRPKIPRTRLRK